MQNARINTLKVMKSGKKPSKKKSYNGIKTKNKQL